MLSDIAKLTEEKEKVTRQFELDIAKRKYQYESKREQYFRYFNLIDQFNTEYTLQTQEVIIPSVNRFYQDYLNAKSISKQNQAIVTYTSTVNEVLVASNKMLLKIRHETHTIRLIASDNVLTYLNILESNYSLLFERSAKHLTEMSALIISKQEGKLQEHRMELETIARLIKSVEEKLLNEIKLELNEI